MSKERVSWNTYFMNIAQEVSTRSTCNRKHVGAVIVRNKTILSTGYNGSIKGLPHCDEVGCEMVDGHTVFELRMLKQMQLFRQQKMVLRLMGLKYT